MARATTCPKCGKRMEQGHVPDAGHHSLMKPSTWVAGWPKKSWWGGFKQPAREDCVPLIALRCEGCGFVEFYAGDVFHP